MNIAPLLKFWPLMYSVIREFWGITEQCIEDAAARDDIPLELYFYSELGLDVFSTEYFQKRDPFTNPEQFEKNFARLTLKGWVEPLEDGQYQVTDAARDGVRRIICAGDEQLAGFCSMPDHDLERLTLLLMQLVSESKITRPPPDKWAIFKRFRVADKRSPWIVQVREFLMDMYAYRDDSHLSAARPHFNAAGVVWLVLSSLAKGSVVTAEQMVESMPFRGYASEDYEVAIQAAVEVGWAEPANHPNAFRLTSKGKELREVTEHLTNAYFYAPWAMLVPGEIDELYDLLITLRNELSVYRNSKVR